MRTLLICVIFLITTTALFGQAPQKINYQGSAYDNGIPIGNQLISVKMSILKSSAAGVAVYSESHTVITNDFGIFSLPVGDGTVISGDISVIDWGADSYFLQVELDPTGGIAYQLMGASQLLSVPYALYANKTESANVLNGFNLSPTIPSNNQALLWNGTSWTPADLPSANISLTQGPGISLSANPITGTGTISSAFGSSIDGSEITNGTITSTHLASGLIPDNNDFVDLTSNQSIDGIKTFNDTTNFGLDVFVGDDLLVADMLTVNGAGILTKGVIQAEKGLEIREESLALLMKDANNLNYGIIQENAGNLEIFSQTGEVKIDDNVDLNGNTLKLKGNDATIFTSGAGNIIFNNYGFIDFQSLFGVNVSGNLDVTGALTKSSGTFKIDHPDDPYNKFLYHSFVESPDMMNIYNGNVRTDQKGEAEVNLPDYFESLNIDYRYQLTVIGDFAQAIILEEINNGQFIIKTDKPNIKVSWQVTGVRNDAYAKENRVVPVVEKPIDQQGTLLYNAAESIK